MVRRRDRRRGAAPPINDAIRAELVDYFARRKTEIGTAEIA